MATVKQLDIHNGNYVFTLPYGTCTTEAATAAKACSVTGFSLITGARVLVNFSYAHNSTTAATLNVTSTGAKTIKTCDGSDVTSENGHLLDNNCELYYDGTNWVIMNPVKHAITSEEITNLFD